MIGAETHPRLDPQYRSDKDDTLGRPPLDPDRPAKHLLHLLHAASQLGPSHASDTAVLVAGARQAQSSQATGYAVSSRRGAPDGMDGHNGAARPHSSSNSPNSNNSDDADRVFTSSASQGSMSAGNGNDPNSSQESQLQRLSQLAAVQDKMPGIEVPASPVTAISRKRMADGMVKDASERLSTSPIRSGGHSRNTSTISIASTAGSRIGELSAELKARLSYAMVKVNHGWHSHTIDQVESMTSQAASPTSSNSTVHGRHGASASPQLAPGHRASNNTTPASATLSHFDGSWAERSHLTGSPALPPPFAQSRPAPSLAPPISLQPARYNANARRNSNPPFVPPQLRPQPHQGSPQTPGQPSPMQAPHIRSMATPVVDPILFSPDQNVREKDAIETLLFMSSPGNSANLKHTFASSSSQPLPSMRNGHSAISSPHRTALPGSQPRKSLPSARPAHSQPTKRVGFEKSPSNLSDMEVDESFGTPSAAASPYSRGTPRRRPNGNHSAAEVAAQRMKVPLSVPSGLSGTSKPRPALREADIEKMLDMAAAAESSDSEDEIQIPVRRAGAGPVGT